MYPTIDLLVTSLLTFVLDKTFQDYWTIVLLVVDILLIVTNLLPKKSRDLTPPTNPS